MIYHSASLYYTDISSENEEKKKKKHVAQNKEFVKFVAYSEIKNCDQIFDHVSESESTDHIYIYICI